MSRAWRDSQWVYQREIDSTNFVKLSGIISKYGFPKSYVDTWEVMTILLQNTDRMNADFLRQLKEEVFAGNLEALVYAQIYDRVQADRNLPRLYYVPEPLGSTSDTSKIGKPASRHATNKARREIGLKKWKG